MLAPAHFANVDKAFNARCDFNKCTIVSHNHYLALNLVTYLEVRIEGIPRMRSELLETEGDTLLLFVEIEDNNVELLVEFHNFVGIVYAAP